MFEAAALKHIAHLADGLTRRINVLADKALLAAFAAGRHLVGKAEVRQAARDAEIGRRVRLGWPWLAAAPLALAAAAWLATPRQPVAGGGGASAALPPATAASVAVPAPQIPTTAVPAPLPAPAAPEPDTAYGPLTRARLEASLPWLRQSGEDRWMVQIASVAAARPRDIESLVNQLAAASAGQPVHLLESGPPQARQVALLFGDFPDRAAAHRALAQLPAALRAFQPDPRTVRAVRDR